MKRDMDLIREILLTIESMHQGTALYDISVGNHSKEEIAFHCKLLHEAGIVSDYKGLWADGGLYSFGVGGLTWDGYDYLDKVRDNTIWKKTKDAIKDKGLPLIFDTIKTISSAFITAAAEGVANSIIKNGGQI